MIKNQTLNNLFLEFQTNSNQANINEGQANTAANNNAQGDKNCN